jgi:uncharacterized membrane protein (UPF0127 family)
MAVAERLMMRTFPAFTLTVLMLLLGACDSPGTGTTVTWKVPGQALHLELALDDAARMQGLSDRKNLPADGGMLFVFPQPQPLIFVMRKCWVPIDVVFVDPSGRIDSCLEMQVEPYDTPEERLTMYRSGASCQYAIELVGGTAKKLMLKAGQAVDLPFEALKQRAR